MIINMGLVVAITPDDPDFDKDPHQIDWSGKFEELGYNINGGQAVRVLHGTYDVPGVLAMHEVGMSFHPETKFVSVTAAVYPCIMEVNEWPAYTGNTDVTAVIETGSAFRVPRAVVDNQDRLQGLKAKRVDLP